MAGRRASGAAVVVLLLLAASVAGECVPADLTPAVRRLVVPVVRAYLAYTSDPRPEEQRGDVVSRHSVQSRGLPRLMARYEKRVVARSRIEGSGCSG